MIFQGKQVSPNISSYVLVLNSNGTLVTVQGSFFLPNMILYFNNVQISFTFISDTSFLFYAPVNAKSDEEFYVYKLGYSAVLDPSPDGITINYLSSESNKIKYIK
jgi:hypothetical protein